MERATACVFAIAKPSAAENMLMESAATAISRRRKHGGGQHREFLAHARFGHVGIKPQSAMQRCALTHMVNRFVRRATAGKNGR